MKGESDVQTLLNTPRAAYIFYHDEVAGEEERDRQAFSGEEGRRQARQEREEDKRTKRRRDEEKEEEGEEE